MFKQLVLDKVRSRVWNLPVVCCRAHMSSAAWRWDEERGLKVNVAIWLDVVPLSFYLDRREHKAGRDWSDRVQESTQNGRRNFREWYPIASESIVPLRPFHPTVEDGVASKAALDQCKSFHISDLEVAVYHSGHRC